MNVFVRTFKVRYSQRMGEAMNMGFSNLITKLRWPFLLGFPVFSLITVFWSPFPWDTIGSAGVLMIVSIIIGTIPKVSRRFLSVVLVSGNAFMPLLLLVVSFATLLFAVDSGSGRFFAPFFTGPGPAGATVALLTLGAFASVRMFSKWKSCLVLSLIGILGASVVSLSGSRLAALALFLGTLVFLLLDRSLPKLCGSISVVAGLGLGSLTQVTMVLVRPAEMSSLEQGRLIERALGDAGNDFSSGRVAIWTEAIAQVPDGLIPGVGFDSSQKAGGLMAHNQLLTVSVEVGILGLCLFILFLIAILNDLRPSFIRNPYTPALICGASMLMGDSFLFGWRNPNAIVFWLILLLALVWSAWESQYKDHIDSRTRHAKSRFEGSREV